MRDGGPGRRGHDRVPRVVVVGVGHAAFDALRYHLRTDVRRAVWEVLLVAYRDFEDGRLNQISIHAVPPKESGTGASDPWEQARSAGLPATGVSHLLRRADVIVVVGGLDRLTRLFLRDLGPLPALRVFLCLTRYPAGSKGAVRRQRRELESLGTFVDTAFEVPVLPVREDPQDETPVCLDRDARRLIGRCVGSLCAAIVVGRCSVGEARKLFRSGGFGGIAVGTVTRSAGVSEAVAAARGDRPTVVSGGFRLDRARKLWVGVDGGKDTGALLGACLGELGRFRLSRVRDLRTASTRTAGRALTVTIMAFGFSRPSSVPTPLLTEAERGEARARTLLRRVVPDQVDRYDARGFVEAKSRLHAGRTYRIHRTGPYATGMHRRGRQIGAACLQFTDPSLPTTDRVIAEYLMIRSDEADYLERAAVGWSRYKDSPLGQGDARATAPDPTVVQSIQTMLPAGEATRARNREP